MSFLIDIVKVFTYECVLESVIFQFLSKLTICNHTSYGYVCSDLIISRHLFQVDEDSVFRHKGERRVRTLDDDDANITVESEPSLDPDSTPQSDSTGDAIRVESDGEASDSSSDADSEMDDNIDPSSSEKVVTDSSDRPEKTDQSELEASVADLNVGVAVKRSPECNVSDGDADNVEQQADVKETAGNDEAADDDEETFFPDTAIELQYKKGER